MMKSHNKEIPHFYAVSAAKKKRVLDFILDALQVCGCRVIHAPDPRFAPYRIVFDTPQGERIGIMAYAFFANSRRTHNRPDDEHRFQVKYGTKDGKLHPIWQDPYGVYTTLFFGVDPDEEIFVGADPVLHSPTRFFISIEFKQSHVHEIKRKNWVAWERSRRGESDESAEEPVEVLVGGTRDAFLRYVRFEREALGEDQGHRQLLAEKGFKARLGEWTETGQLLLPEARVHTLSTEFQLAPDEILDVIAEARRLKMAVRGWVAELHLVRQLSKLRGVSECQRLDEDGSPDISLRYLGSGPLLVECKNVLRKVASDKTPRLDFQRTRASKADPCSRYYQPSDFDVVAACLHAVTEKWEYRFARTTALDSHPKCKGRLSSNVRVGETWEQLERIDGLLRSVAQQKGR